MRAKGKIKYLNAHGGCPGGPKCLHCTWDSLYISVEGPHAKYIKGHVSELQGVWVECYSTSFSDLASVCRAPERDLSLSRVRVRVHENPHTRVHLDRRLFLGPFDGRYGVIDGQKRFGQIYAGSGVADFEKLSSTARLLSRS